MSLSEALSNVSGCASQNSLIHLYTYVLTQPLSKAKPVVDILTLKYTNRKQSLDDSLGARADTKSWAISGMTEYTLACSFWRQNSIALPSNGVEMTSLYSLIQGGPKKLDCF